ncbi:MAG: type II secretion system protein M [Ectothiorhodospiraceae bacterium]|nr:type II secretion system protein M [Chromatiales bacterium]MCP5154971.1 type II secretion system protein M [Ectothiorhodospiraceae bacterium]
MSDAAMRWFAARVDPRSTALLVAGTVAILALLAWFHVLRPPLTRLDALRTSVATARATLAREHAGVTQADVDALRARVDELRARLADGAGADAERLAETIRGLDASARRRGIEIGSVEPLAPVPRGDVEELGIEVTLSGRYEALFAWLGEAEEGAGEMLVQRFHLDAGDDDARRMTLRLVTFRAVAPP